MTPELCAACHHAKDDSTMHLDAPGENWGAALHWYEPPTPELEAKAREFLQDGGYKFGDLAAFAASQLEIERKWWITRIEQERDKYYKASQVTWDDIGKGDALDDLLTSVRERG